MIVTRSAPPPKPPNARLRLRSDLLVSPSEDGGFVLEDLRSGQFFRLGQAEYSVVAQLDGKTELPEAIRRATRGRAGSELTAKRCEALIPWLLTAGIVEPDTAPTRAAPASETALAPQTFNPCYFRISLGAPKAMLTALNRGIGWLCTLPAVAIVAALSILAGLVIANQWERFSGSLGNVLCPDQHLALIGCWLVLKVAHELGHGIACQRLGGDVREFGLAFMYMMPVPYTDVTSSWRFGSRGDRMAVAAAGMYFEWLLALIAVAIWCFVSSPSLRQMCVYTVSLATLTTILFNANPLCRLDGYYLLSDWLRWPNLSQQGQQCMTDTWLRFLGSKTGSMSTVVGPRFYYAWLYGVASAIWRLLTLSTMVIVAIISYEGLGVLLIGAILAYSYFTSLGQRSANPKRSGLKLGAVVRCASLALVVAAIVWLVPWPLSVSAPGIVSSPGEQIVRATSGGHVAQVLVKDGAWVEAGTTLAVLKNELLERELAESEFQLAQIESRLRSLHSKRQLVDLQVEQQRQQTIAAKVSEQRQKIAALTLKAPTAGRVVARRLADLPGSFLAEGAELCAIVDKSREFRVSIAQADVPRFAPYVGQAVSIRVANRQISGTLARLDPQASTQLADPALGANFGGPLAVMPRQTASSRSAAPDWQLTEPRVTGTIAFEANNEESPLGQRGTAMTQAHHRSLADVMAVSARDWLDRLQRQALAK